MFGLVVRFDLVPGAGLAFDALVQETLEKIWVREPRTLIYSCHDVDAAPHSRIFYELYKDRAAFDEHSGATTSAGSWRSASSTWRLRRRSNSCRYAPATTPASSLRRGWLTDRFARTPALAADVWLGGLVANALTAARRHRLLILPGPSHGSALYPDVDGRSSPMRS
jgi:quinol monooxygenase YgiN